MTMRYLTPSEARQAGYEPYAVYGGKVYSMHATWNNGEILIVHDSELYKKILDKLNPQG